MTRLSIVCLLCLAAPLSAAAPPVRVVPPPLPAGAVARLGYAKRVARSYALHASPDGRWAVLDGGRCFDLAEGEEKPPPVAVPEGYRLHRLLSGGAYVVRGKDYAIVRPDEEPTHFGTDTQELADATFDARGDVGLNVRGAWVVRLADLRQRQGVKWRSVVALGDPKKSYPHYVRLASGGTRLVWWDGTKAELGVHDVQSAQTRLFGDKAGVKFNYLDGLAVSPDGRQAVLLRDKVLAFFDLNAGKLTRRAEVSAPKDVEDVWFTPDGKAVVIHAWDKYLVIALDAAERWSVSLQAGWRGWGDKILLAPLPDSKRLLTLDQHNVLRVRDLRTGEPIDAHTRYNCFDGVQALASHRAASWGRDGTVVIWDTRTGRATSEVKLKPVLDDFDFFHRMSFSRDGKYVAVTLHAGDPECVLAEAATGKVIHRADGFVCFHPSGTSALLLRKTDDKRKPAAAFFDLTRRAWGRPFAISDYEPQVAFAADGRTYLRADAFRIALAESASDRARWETHLAHTDEKRGDRSTLAVLARGGRRAVVARLRDVIALDVQTGHVAAHVHFRDGEPDKPDVAAVSASGRWLAIAHRYNTPSLFDLDAETPGDDLLRKFPTKTATAVALNDDGTRLITSHGDGTCVVWDVTKFVPPTPKKKPADAWDLLARVDPVEARPAIAALRTDAARAIKVFSARLNAAADVGQGKIAGWVKELDSEDFDVRTAAERRLHEAGDQAEEAMRRAVRKPASVEQARRAEALLKKLDAKDDGKHLRELRALEILEALASKEAVALLEKLAKGAPSARLTREAKASLKRLRERDES